MIHWDGPYVEGFLSFGETPKQAVTALKRSLWAKLQLNKKRNDRDKDHSELSTINIKAFFRSLKRPWRKTKKGYSVVQVEQLMLPLMSGYWLRDVIRGECLCNLPSNDNPAEVYWEKAGEK